MLINIWEHINFYDPTFRKVALGCILIAIISSQIGTFTLLRKKALVGDAVAHAVLPGICLAFILAGEKNPIMLFAGAMISGYLSLFFIDYVTLKSRIKQDTALAMVITLFFSVGILLLVYIQHNTDSGQNFSGINNFIYGSATGIEQQDIYLYIVCLVIFTLLIYVFYKELKVLTFDREFAKSIDINVKFFDWLFTTMTIVAIVLGIQTVGVILMSALLITPPAIARFWSNKLLSIIVIAIVVSIVSCLSGAVVTTIYNAPTGPWIVAILSSIAFLSFFFSPQKGILYKIIQQLRHRRKMLEENILKTLYHLYEKNEYNLRPYSIREIIGKRTFDKSKLKYGLRKLRSNRFIKKENQQLFILTNAGLEKGRRITKIHRLWELYLTEYLRIAPDHVHEDAENIEHIITPELEAELEKLLDFPKVDPHNKNVPYKHPKHAD